MDRQCPEEEGNPSRKPTDNDGLSVDKGWTLGKHLGKHGRNESLVSGYQGATKGTPEVDPGWTRVHSPRLSD